MSYFHTGTRTIIGAEAFHCPVRDGKEWDHLAMVIRLNRSPSSVLLSIKGRQDGQFAESPRCDQHSEESDFDRVPNSIEDRHNT
jgi:hypothetical protein